MKLSTQMNKVENIGLCRKLAWSFFATTGVDYEELQSEAILAYYNGLETYDEAKGVKVSTHVYNYIKNALCDFTKRTNRDVLIDEIPDYIQPTHTTMPVFMQKEELQHILNGMSDTARELVEMVFTTPELSVNRPPKMIRGLIVQMLRKKGWKWQVIWGTMNEVKQAISI